VAFSCVAFALMGLGLTIAALADTVPAVQALGQCVFLPMLILGGVAVPLASLPAWAERLSTFFPGRYAVEAIDATVAGPGLRAAVFALSALVAIGLASCLAGVQMFRWDRGQRFSAVRGKGWIAVAVGMWVMVGALSRARHVTAAPPQPPPPAAQVAAAPVETAPAVAPAASPSPAVTADTAHVPPPAKKPRAAGTAPEIVLSSWREVTRADVVRDITFTRLPPDAGIVTPIAGPADVPDADTASQIAEIEGSLATWAPGHVDDPVQRVRNLLAILATPDVLQQPFERYLPAVIFGHLQKTMAERQLVQVLYWIAMHPDGGTQPSAEELEAVGLPAAGADPLETRNRAAIYGVKLLGRVMGRL
jgi:ABC-2 type transport system permease protein